MSFWESDTGEWEEVSSMTSESLSPPPPPLLRDNGSHLGCCRFEPQVSVTPTVLSACDIPKWLGPAGLAKNAGRTKINLPHSLAAPCPFPLSSHPSSPHSLPGKAGRGTAGWRKPVLLPSNPEKERERGTEEEKERERSPYMGACADNVWQWLRGQRRSDTRQMEEIKHGTERFPGP